MAPHSYSANDEGGSRGLASSSPPVIANANDRGTRPAPRIITLDLLRKRSEHNEGLVSSLEELALHQEELQALGPILGRTCGKTLKILLLQNNVIGRMDPSELKLCRSLEYLNLALNNVTKIEGVGGMEWLRKLDLTLNFIDVDALEASVDELSRCRSLEELFLLGNPCMSDHNDGVPLEGASPQKQRGWSGCRAYVVARLTSLQSLDGTEIKRSERILAVQQLPALTSELHSLAEARRQKRQAESRRYPMEESCTEDGDRELAEGRYIADEAPTHHNPDTRTKMSNEMHDQKRAKEDQEKANQPPKLKGEKEWVDEHREAVQKAREREQRAKAKGRENDHGAGPRPLPEGGSRANIDGRIKQCNQGKYQFWFEEEERRDRHSNASGSLILRVAVPKHLSTSLIDVDVHPTYVSIVIKTKVLRVVLPLEVQSDRSAARRSAASGHLEVIMPKADPDEVAFGLGHVRERGRSEEAPIGCTERGTRGAEATSRREHLGQLILKEAGKMPSLHIVQNEVSGDKNKKLTLKSYAEDNDDEPPPLY